MNINTRFDVTPSTNMFQLNVSTKQIFAAISVPIYPCEGFFSMKQHVIFVKFVNTLSLCIYTSHAKKNPKSEVCKTVTSPFDIHVDSSSVVFMIHAASWHETFTHKHTQTIAMWCISMKLRGSVCRQRLLLLVDCAASCTAHIIQLSLQFTHFQLISSTQFHTLTISLWRLTDTDNIYIFTTYVSYSTIIHPTAPYVQ